jgi:GMC oxidoreductase
VCQQLTVAHNARQAMARLPSFRLVMFEIGYRPETNTRSSSSICYLHPVHPAQRSRASLRTLLRTRALRLILDGDNRAAGVLVRSGDGAVSEIFACREVVVCAGAIDSPRLLQLSGIGPAAVLDAVGVDVRVDLPGVGENLMDHAEGIVVWRSRSRGCVVICAHREVPGTCIGIFGGAHPGRRAGSWPRAVRPEPSAGLLTHAPALSGPGM